MGIKRKSESRTMVLSEISVTDLYEILICDVAFGLSGDKQRIANILLKRERLEGS